MEQIKAEELAKQFEESMRKVGMRASEMIEKANKNLEEQMLEERRRRLELEKMGVYGVLDIPTPFTPYDEIRQKMEADWRLIEEQRTTRAENPLEAYSTTELKAELRRRKKNGNVKKLIERGE